MALAAFPAAAGATFPGSNGVIAYGLRGDIWTINPASREQSRLIIDGSRPAWSANGQRLAFVRGGEIWVAHADGSDQVRLTSPDDLGVKSPPSWSPDGTRIAYADKVGVVVMRADGSGEQRLTEEGEEPSWSPDGTRIAYSAGGVWTMTPSGGDRRRIAPEFYSGDYEGDHQYPYIAWRLDWSPDGRQLVAQYSYTGSAIAYYVFRIPAGGGALTTFNPTDISGAASWSPDGRHVVVSHWDGMVLLNVAGGSRYLTGQGGFFDYGPPAWQPLPPPRPSDDTPPFVAWVKPRTGEVIGGVLSEAGGTCLVEANDPSGIARTENYVDGEFHDRQVTAPWSCEIDTRTLSNGPHTLKVRAYDRAGNYAEASAHITVRNPGSSPATQPTSNPGSGGGETPGPSGTTNPPPAAGGSSGRLTAKQARRGIVQALTRKHGSFRRRRSHTIRCKASASGTTQTCTTRWTTRTKAYTARIRVRRGTSGLVVRVLTLRVKPRS